MVINDDKGVLVTGGAKGIGAAVTRKFVHAGAKVLVLDSDAQACDSIIEEFGEDRVRALCGDVRDAGFVDLAITKLMDFAGNLSVGINNAGIGGAHRKLFDYSDEEYDLIMDVNVKGIFNAMRAEIRIMHKLGRGSIVNMASAIGMVGAANQSIYSASKHAIVGLTRSAAIDFAEAGIRINCICPGVIESNLTRSAMSKDAKLGQIWQSLHPIGRLGKPEEVADVAWWLAEAAPEFISGAAIAVDGGYTAR